MVPLANAGTDNRAPEVPTGIALTAPAKVQFHVYAEGVQIYAWTINPTNGVGSWVFQAPEAVLFDADDNIVGIHYAGPTWETASGSIVKGTRLSGVTVDTNAIPWLLLQGRDQEGPGLFARTTYIHRVNTVGGLAPSAPGTTAGQIARVPYLAEYYFYRAE
jgi:hypothetical protein